MYIATVAIIIDVSTLGTPEVEWGMSPCKSRPPFWRLILWWNRGGDLGERAPGDFTFGCPICNWAELQCGSTPGSQAGWHALLLLLLLLLLQHYHKGLGSPRPLSGVYIEHWCNDIVVVVPVSSKLKKKIHALPSQRAWYIYPSTSPQTSLGTVLSIFLRHTVSFHRVISFTVLWYKVGSNFK